MFNTGDLEEVILLLVSVGKIFILDSSKSVDSIATKRFRELLEVRLLKSIEWFVIV